MITDLYGANIENLLSIVAKFVSQMLVLRVLCVVVSLTTLLGCSKPSFEAEFDDYISRLERVLEQERKAPTGIVKTRYPAQRSVHIEVPAINIDLFEYLKLGECEIQGVIADKNSSLGRMAEASIVLQQDINFLLLAEQCIARLEDQDLVATLTSAALQKRLALKAILWNAIFAGPEYRALWNESQVEYPYQPESRLQGALSVVQTQVLHVLDGRLAAFDAEQFEAALQILRTGEAGALLGSWQLAKRELEVATSLLIERQERRPLCFKDMRNSKAEFFRNVVVEKFVGGLQKNLAVINQRYYDVMPPVQALEAQFTEVETETYRQYRLARDAEFELALAAVKAHVDAIQPLMVQCGFLPSS